MRENLSAKQKKIRWIFGAFALCWMIMIFLFSAQEAEESTEVSLGLSYQMAQTTSNIFHLNWNNERVREVAGEIEGFVRKAAHMTEYAILEISLFLWMYLFWENERIRMIISFVISALYAGSDEFHQLFVAGRTGKFTDVLIDCGGVVIAIGCIMIVCYFIQKKRKHD